MITYLDMDNYEVFSINKGSYQISENRRAKNPENLNRDKDKTIKYFQLRSI